MVSLRVEPCCYVAASGRPKALYYLGHGGAHIPNTAHPTGRPAVRPATSFSFSNCYHWIDYEIVVRVKNVEGGWDHSHAISIGKSQFRQVEKTFGQDWGRVRQLLDERGPAERAHGSDADVFNPASSSSHSSTDLPHEAQPDRSQGSQDSDRGSSTIDSDVSSIDVPDLFGDDVDPRVAELLPLVNLWLDITEHLEEDTIPNPEDLFHERDAIVSIIHEARKRRAQRKAVEREARTQHPGIDYGVSPPVPLDDAVPPIERHSPASGKPAGQPEASRSTAKELSASFRRIFTRISRAIRDVLSFP
ncbi:hypothetical protein L227DRAFT_653068 [Lentinus tigrinus ALCF2SS1-6]|uniref:Uncharacterized protein n=1 Tax=Lentinus tigrinus ALCF2SS1-6 TaxID=1328759 RepID=A0A5C2SBY1_9APHY|nr:hypothetical protein L227DRAFT_653068 [Lentinus tigrinus ALCF2SS1-6]